VLIAHSKSARVASPASAVWQLVGDPTAWERWAGGIDGVSVRDGLAVGRTITYRHRGRPVDVVISAYEPQRRLAITRTEPSYEMRESIELEGDEEETTVSIAMAFEPLALWARVELRSSPRFGASSSAHRLRALCRRFETKPRGPKATRRRGCDLQDASRC
jgi:uncharacterized protein YndB with AHSA1/START domain